MSTTSAFIDQTKYPKTALQTIMVPLFAIPICCYVYALNTVFILLLAFVFILLAIGGYYMYKTRLTVELTSKGVSYALQSFSTKTGQIPLSEIIHIEVVALDYTSKFGGWGYRKNKNGEAFIFNDGLFLHVQTAHQVYYFSISDAQKKACRNLLEQYSLPYTKKE